MGPLQVGITGGIGSGKSILCRIFNCLGVPVYDADSRAKRVMTTDGILVEQIKKEFGKLSYHPDGGLNRNYLAEKTFAHPERLEKLNELVHPRVAADYAQWLKDCNGSMYVIKEAALLFESGSYDELDYVVLVSAPEELRIKRVIERDPQRTEEEVRAIMSRQWNESEKEKMSDYIIVNDGLTPVIPRVLELHQKFLASR